MEFVKRSGIKKIITTQDFNDIVNFVCNYNGLAVECELSLLRDERFAQYATDTLKHIVEMQSINNLRLNGRESEIKSKIFIKRHMKELLEGNNTKLMLNYANTNALSPVRLARKVLQSVYHKKTVTNILKYTHLVENHNLQANINTCLMHDILDGPLVDMRRRFTGEEHEYKLKKFCIDLGLSFQDEGELRNLGFDKTPDIRLTLPILYQGKVINWIESKAVFGDKQTHKCYLQTQLNSYINRFGSGMLIYWFGHTADLPTLEANMSINVLHELPKLEDLEFMKMC